MTLTCKTQQLAQKPDVQLKFCFFRDGQALGLGWNSSPELQIATMWREDSGSYWCEEKIAALKDTRSWSRSRRVHISVQRPSCVTCVRAGIPIRDVSLEIQPPGGHVMEGEKLVLVCLAAGGTGNITFLWYKGALGLALEKKTQRSLTAKFEIPTVRESDAEKYYCAADNGYGPSLSGLVSVTVRIPVSRPVLTLKSPGAQTMMGDMVELRCEAQRGSPPIQYRFYHKNVTLGSSSAPFGGGVSFNLSLTAEHSGNYSCEAKNGWEAQRSEVVALNITVPAEDRRELLTSVMEGLLGILGPTAGALLLCCWLKRKIGRRSARDPLSHPPSPTPQESNYLNSAAPEQQQPVYENVNIVSGDEVYSLVYCVQQEQRTAAGKPPRTHAGDRDPSDIYFRLKEENAPVSEQSDWLTLLAPSSVFEGDSVVLTCQRKRDWKVNTMTYYKDGKMLHFSNKASSFPIPSVVLSDSGNYHCTATGRKYFQRTDISAEVNIEVQELFLQPVLTVSPSWPTEGSPVTLTCETQLSPQRSYVQLQFCFFRGGRARGSGCSSSPELQIPAMWREDSGSYWCKAETVTHRVRKWSLQSQIHVQSVPVSNVTLETQAPGGQVIEGRTLVLLCSVAEGTGNITFSWHREATGPSLGRQTQHSLSAELEIPAVREADAGQYYCRADNGHGPIWSKMVTVPVRIPVSRPVLTLGAPGAQAAVGDVVELRCETQRGSPPILYRFYHEDVTLGSSSALFGGGASFNLSLMEEHSGNVSCEADNGLGAQRSEAVPLTVSGTGGYRRNPVTASVLGGLSGALGFVAVALFYRCSHKVSDAFGPNPQESPHSSPLPATEELQPVYANVDPVEADVVYSQVWSIQLAEGSGEKLQSGSCQMHLPRKLAHQIRSPCFCGCWFCSWLLEENNQFSTHLPFAFTCLHLSISYLGIAPKAFILLKPPWSRFFKEETVTLICKDRHSSVQGGISWYYDKKLLKRQSEEIQINTSGYYKCKTQGSSFSDPVLVEFLSDWLILQASYPVFEGDNVVLKCRAKKEEEASAKIYYKNEKRLSDSYSSKFMLNSVSRDNGKYHCTASKATFLFITKSETSKPLMIQVQGNSYIPVGNRARQGNKLFSPPVLRASPSHSIEGNPVTLKCETWLSPQKADTQLQFRFFKENQALGSGWSSSPELQIPALWTEDSWSYWCQAETVTHNIIKRSLRSQIHVQRVPVSDVTLEIQPPEGRIVGGGNLVLICSVAKGTGTITFSWHREGIERSLGRKIQRSLSAELQIPSVKEGDAGRYYCAADNSKGPILSQRIRVTLGIPVSCPVLTLGAPGAQAVVGDVVELRCEAQRGSPPILYRFYHEDVGLGSSSAPSGGGVSFNLSLAAEHSGNFSCEADNGLGVQRSDSMTLNVTVSRPILTLNPVGAQDMAGDVLELRCEAQRGSPPILYWFYHEDVTLGNSSAPFGGGASFNLSLMEEHSGNYSCIADNGLGAQRSEVVTLNFTGPSRNKGILIPVRVTGWLVGILGLAAAAVVLVGHFRTQRKSVPVGIGSLPRPALPAQTPKSPPTVSH
ncbi:hypothetical protein MC885_017349 [Smutsia gigantea]|nr:hypothetical protein MC885_017349 [Smutsia gigantea]